MDIPMSLPKERLEVHVRCPDCAKSTRHAITWLHHDCRFRCPACGADFRVKGGDFRKVREAVEQLFASLPKAS
jgi:transposase-like protein